MKKLCSLLCLLLLLTAFLPAGAEEEILPITEAQPPSSWEGPFLAPGSEPVWTENSYISENIAITITARRMEIPVNVKTIQKSDVFIADIRIRTLDCFQRACPGNKWKSTTQRITTLSENNQAILSMSGDSAANLTAGWVIINGEIARDGSKKGNRTRDLGILYRTGELVTVSAKEFSSENIKQEAENGEIWQLFLFGPRLLDDEGRAMTKFNSKVGPVNPRSVIGYYEPGHYCFVQVDGRQTKSQLEAGKKNKGLTLTSLSRLMEELGCKAAYNLDGGRTSQMYFGGKVISAPQDGGRRLGDIVLIREP
ncbi:MAG: phosphodiester glycosidase family protein [Clostridiales bacterium]|nr:phosphodiester glycosidase family protein [Clostridiales bacterium]